jgi:hypothetical protein
VIFSGRLSFLCAAGGATGGKGGGKGGGGNDRQEGDFSSFGQRSSGGGSYGGGGGGGRDGRPGDWPCASCQASNFASRNACFKCNAPRADGGGGSYGGGGAMLLSVGVDLVVVLFMLLWFLLPNPSFAFRRQPWWR